MISGFKAREMPQLPTTGVGVVTETTIFEPQLTGVTPFPLNFSHSRYLGQRAAEKPLTFLSHFQGLVPDTNYEHLESFVMAVPCKVKP